MDRTFYYATAVAVGLAALVTPEYTAGLLSAAIVALATGGYASFRTDRQKWEAEFRQFRRHLIAFGLELDKAYKPVPHLPGPQTWNQLAERAKWPRLPGNQSLRLSRAQPDLWQDENRRAAIRFAEGIYPPGSSPGTAAVHAARHQVKMCCEEWGNRASARRWNREVGFWQYFKRRLKRKKNWQAVLIVMAYLEVALASTMIRSDIPPNDDAFFTLGNRLWSER